MEIKELLDRASTYLPAEKVEIVQRAYEFALQAHKGQFRKSGESYIEHPLNVAMILAELQLDASTLAAALLHDVEENCGVTSAELVEKFGAEVAK
ncbi:MAG: HD domain-containing protein, partial [Dehalococcoidales bacterium]|nr:HD domain-containing protein [Dehalococcoidales bacterium]